jgi:predicted DNA binding CopG/RHH family protein
MENKQVNVRMSAVLIERVKEMAGRQGVHTSELIRRAIVDYLQKQEAFYK